MRKTPNRIGVFLKRAFSCDAIFTTEINQSHIKAHTFYEKQHSGYLEADTLRAYLQNSNIVTLKFMIAHRPEYKALHNGVYAGMNPAALTVVVVGQDDDDNYVLNSHNEVYEHMMPCPSYCAGGSTAYIH